MKIVIFVWIATMILAVLSMIFDGNPAPYVAASLLSAAMMGVINELKGQ